MPGTVESMLNDTYDRHGLGIPPRRKRAQARAIDAVLDVVRCMLCASGVRAILTLVDELRVAMDKVDE